VNEAPEIIESSGSEQLDAAAQDWANAADWIPATRQNAAVEGCTRVRVEFRLG
jgi:outer membrane biosynthesis protein TonB